MDTNTKLMYVKQNIISLAGHDAPLSSLHADLGAVKDFCDEQKIRASNLAEERAAIAEEAKTEGE